VEFIEDACSLLNMPREHQNRPHLLAEQERSNKLIELVRKLRWMGLDEQAVKVEEELSVRREPADTVIAGPRETD
jgi:hypothetical protein